MKRLPPTRSILLIATLALCAPAVQAASPDGMSLTLSPTKGNCIACHQLGNNPNAGNIGPALSGIKQKFPERKKLQQLLWDPTSSAPNTIMPPFGKHHLLSADEIDKIINYLYSL